MITGGGLCNISTPMSRLDRPPWDHGNGSAHMLPHKQLCFTVPLALPTRPGVDLWSLFGLNCPLSLSLRLGEGRIACCMIKSILLSKRPYLVSR